MKITINISRPKPKRPDPQENLNRKLPKRRLLISLVVIIIITGLTSAAIFVIGHQRQSGNNPAESKVARVMRLVAAHYILPKGEEPALATVEDTNKLTTPFLRQSENGDEILIYQKAGVAIIYRPAADRIVAVGPVSIDTPKQPKTSK